MKLLLAGAAGWAGAATGLGQLTGCPTAAWLGWTPLAVNTFVSDSEPVYSSLSQSSAAGKSSPQLPARNREVIFYL